MEELIKAQPGVISTEVGYTGGDNESPTYENHPGHAEAVQITYDPGVTSYRNLLDFFFRVHDPTTLNRQGNDTGTAYRSAIFYHNEAQKKAAQTIIAAMKKAGIYDSPIVTTLEPLTKFYKAEDYHQNYYANNKSQPYCQMVIQPKMEKFEKLFKSRLKKKK